MMRPLKWLLLLPVQLLLIILHGAVEALRAFRLIFAFQPGEGPDAPEVDRESCSVVIVSWNGRKLLEESLPPLFRALSRAGGSHEVLVVDNGSEDGTAEWLAELYPQIRLVALQANLGFGEGNNLGVRAASRDIVVLLNNDMIVEEDFLPPLLDAFEDPSLFAVSCQIEFPPERRREETGNTRGRFRRGYFDLEHAPIGPAHFSRRRLPVLWAGGGASAFHRNRFLQLGGFTSIFSPCYLEDTDLSYRAWRRGWTVQVAAESRVLHKHRSTSARRFAPEQLHALIEERKLWYLWKNFQFRRLLTHFLLYPLDLPEGFGLGAYLWSLRKLPAVLALRFQEPRRAVDDATLEAWTWQPVRFLNRFFPDRSPDAEGGRLKLLIVSAYLPHLGTHGGAGRVFQLMSRAAQRHDVTLVCFIEGSDDERFAQQARDCCRRVIAVPRNEFQPLSPFPYEPFEEFNCPAFRNALAELLAEEDFDIAHFEWTQMALYQDLLPSRTVKILTEIEVNYAAHRTLVKVERNWLKKLRGHYNSLQTLYRELELCRLVDRVVCVTDQDQGYLEGFLEPDRLTVINTGVDPDEFRFEEEGIEPDSIVFVGAFRHSPNVDAMRYFCNEIFPLILRERPQTRLYIVGSSPTRQILELETNPQITVTGFVDDIRGYYQLAQVVVVPLRTGVGIRGKILEGWAIGRATVATSLACQGLRASHGENIMIADQPERFAMWTLSLLRNPGFCRRLGEAGRRTVERHYDWDRLADRVCGLYQDSMQEKE
jgi:O-antigen biosynthesis protein